MSLLPDAPPDGVADALGVVADLDAGLVAGLSRLDGAARERVRELGALFEATPLATVVREATAGLGGGAPSEADVIVLAAARASLLGAVHDALLAQAAAALGRPLPADPEPAPAAPRAPEDEAPLRNARHWLLELAGAGLAHVTAEAVAPFAATLGTLVERPALQRPAAILTGFFDELVEALPVHNRDDVPVPRWPDLWMQCLVAAGPPAAVEEQPLAGTLTPLGVELRQHDHAIAATVHGLLDGALVRATFTGWKVDALTGDEALRALPEPAAAVLGAATSDRLVEVEGTRRGADLLVTKARAGGKHDPFAVKLDGVAPVVAAPADRHPIQIAVPVVLPSCTLSAGDGGLRVAPLGVPLDEVRIGPLHRAAKGELEAAVGVIGLLRWDGGWALQPLDARLPKGRWGLAEAVKAAGKSPRPSDTLSVLTERASKLLRS